MFHSIQRHPGRIRKRNISFVEKNTETSGKDKRKKSVSHKHVSGEDRKKSVSHNHVSGEDRKKSVPHNHVSGEDRKKVFHTIMYPGRMERKCFSQSWIQGG